MPIGAPHSDYLEALARQKALDDTLREQGLAAAGQVTGALQGAQARQDTLAKETADREQKRDAANAEYRLRLQEGSDTALRANNAEFQREREFALTHQHQVTNDELQNTRLRLADERDTKRLSDENDWRAAQANIDEQRIEEEAKARAAQLEHEKNVESGLELERQGMRGIAYANLGRETARDNAEVDYRNRSLDIQAQKERDAAARAAAKGQPTAKDMAALDRKIKAANDLAAIYEKGGVRTGSMAAIVPEGFGGEDLNNAKALTAELSMGVPSAFSGNNRLNMPEYKNTHTDVVGSATSTLSDSDKAKKARFLGTQLQAIKDDYGATAPEATSTAAAPPNPNDEPPPY